MSLCLRDPRPARVEGIRADGGWEQESDGRGLLGGIEFGGTGGDDLHLILSGNDLCRQNAQREIDSHDFFGRHVDAMAVFDGNEQNAAGHGDR